MKRLLKTIAFCYLVSLGGCSETSGFDDKSKLDLSDTGDTEDPSIETTTEPGTAGPDLICADKNYDVNKAPINMLILLDLSESMNDPMFNSSSSILDIVKDALTQTVEANTEMVHFGLMAYPSNCIGMACQVSSEPDLDIGSENNSAIIQTLKNLGEAPLADPIYQIYSIRIRNV